MTDPVTPAAPPANAGYATALQVEALVLQVKELREVAAAQHKRLETLEALAAQVKAMAEKPAPKAGGILRSR